MHTDVNQALKRARKRAMEHRMCWSKNNPDNNSKAWRRHDMTFLISAVVNSSEV